MTTRPRARASAPRAMTPRQIKSFFYRIEALTNDELYDLLREKETTLAKWEADGIFPKRQEVFNAEINSICAVLDHREGKART